jgi:hypothetical protein
MVYAGFMRRLFALLIDLVLAAPIYFGLRAVVPQLWMADAVYMGFLCVAYGLCFCSLHRATPGMRVMKIHAVDAQGNGLTYARVGAWFGASIVMMLVVFSPILWLQKNVDVMAVNKIITEGTAQGQSPDVIMQAFEAKTGMNYTDYLNKLGTAFVLMLVLAFGWIATIVAGKQRAGLHNWVTGVRFVRV